jgi:hypothetical protein
MESPGEKGGTAVFWKGGIDMLTGPQVGVLFIILSILFFGLSLRDYVRSDRKKTPARRAWLRVAVIFAVIGLLLCSRVLGT